MGRTTGRPPPSPPPLAGHPLITLPSARARRAPRTRVHHGGHLCQARHVLQRQVLEVGLPHAQELGQQRHPHVEQLRLLQRDGHRHRLKHDGVHRVVLVHVLHRLRAWVRRAGVVGGGVRGQSGCRVAVAGDAAGNHSCACLWLLWRGNAWLLPLILHAPCRVLSNNASCMPCSTLAPAPRCSPPRMRFTTSTSMRRTDGSSGGGKYCSTRRHLTCRGQPPRKA